MLLALGEVPDYAAGVYVIHNTANDLVYVGATKNFAQRYRCHTTDLINGAHHCQRLQSLVNEVGPLRFIFSCLETLSDSELDLRQLEQKWLDAYSERLLNGTAISGVERLSSRRVDEYHKVQTTMPILAKHLVKLIALETGEQQSDVWLRLAKTEALKVLGVDDAETQGLTIVDHRITPPSYQKSSKQIKKEALRASLIPKK